MDDIQRLQWYSVCIDFIDAFKSIAYKGIPLSLLIQLIIDGDIKRELMKPTFETCLRNKISTEDQIQSSFERFLEPIRSQGLTTNRFSGKIVLYEHLLRFPENILLEYFDPSKTEIIRLLNKKGTKCGIPMIPIYGIKNDKIDLNGLSQSFQAKAKEIFLSFENHPVFDKPKFQKRFIDYIPIILALLVKVDNYFDQVPISCVIVGTTQAIYKTDILSRILTIVAAAKGVPSVCIQHGVIGIEQCFMPVFATKQAVYGQYEKEWYLKRGVPEERLEITGHSRFDNIFTDTHMSKTIFQKKLGLNAQKKWVLMATQPIQSQRSVGKQFIEVLLQNPLIEIIIKPHPTEVKRDPNHGTLSDYKTLCSKYQSVKLIETGVEMYDILENIDAAVINSSTVGLEVVLFDKPLFVLNEDFNYYDKMGNFVQSDPVKLAKLVIQLLQDEELQKDAKRKRKEFLAYAYPERSSGKKLSELINKLTGNGS